MYSQRISQVVLLMVLGVFVLAPPTSYVLAAEPTTVSVAIYSRVEHWQRLIEEFNRQSDDVKAELEVVAARSWDSLAEQVQVRIAAGTGPDIVNTSLTFVSNYRANDLLVDLIPYFNRDGLDIARYYPKIVSNLSVDGKMDLFPVGILSEVVLINEQLFSESGVPLPSRDWISGWDQDQFYELEGRFNRVSGDSAGSPGTRGYYPRNSPSSLLPFVWANGGSWFRESKGQLEFALTEPAARNTLETLEDVFIHQNTLLGSGSLTRFERGELAIATSTSSGAMQASRAPGGAAEYPFDWGVYPFPRGEAGPATALLSDPIAILKTSNHADSAWVFVKWLDSLDAARIMAEAGVFGIHPNREHALTLSEYYYPEHSSANRSVVLESLNVMRNELISNANYSKLWAELQVLFRDAIVTNKIPLAEHIENTARLSNALLREE